MLKMMKYRSVVLGIMGAALLTQMTACQINQAGLDDPKKQLTNYIAKSFEIHSLDDRKALLEYLSGETKERLQAWSDDQFRQAFVDSKRQFVKLAVVDMKKQSEGEASLTYELTYLDQQRGKGAKVTAQRLAMMKKEGDRWLIQEVRNMKELVEFSNEMALP